MINFEVEGIIGMQKQNEGNYTPELNCANVPRLTILPAPD
jgi:hypothetical protein